MPWAKFGDHTGSVTVLLRHDQALLLTDQGDLQKFKDALDVDPGTLLYRTHVSVKINITPDTFENGTATPEGNATPSDPKTYKWKATIVLAEKLSWENLPEIMELAVECPLNGVRGNSVVPTEISSIETDDSGTMTTKNSAQYIGVALVHVIASEDARAEAAGGAFKITILCKVEGDGGDPLTLKLNVATSRLSCVLDNE
jgi:hypothetical protein